MKHKAQYRSWNIGIRADVFDAFDQMYPVQSEKVYVVETALKALTRYGYGLIRMLEAMEQLERDAVFRALHPCEVET
jgi:hypothetical protein